MRASEAIVESNLCFLQLLPLFPILTFLVITRIISYHDLSLYSMELEGESDSKRFLSSSDSKIWTHSCCCRRFVKGRSGRCRIFVRDVSDRFDTSLRWCEVV